MPLLFYPPTYCKQWLKYTSVIYLVVAAILNVHGYKYNNRQTQSFERTLEDNVAAMEKMTNFFAEDYAAVNLDGLFGIRIGEGNIKQTLAECEKQQFHCPQTLMNRLHSLNSLIEEVAEHAMPYVEQQDPSYFHHFKSVLDSACIIHHHTQVIKDFPAISRGNASYDEDQGDACFTKLLGGADHDPKLCTITDDCWEMMTKDNTKGYTLTHQILYFIFAEKHNCINTSIEEWLKKRGNASMREVLTGMCSRVLTETLEESHGGQVKIWMQDLFFEQSLVCGIYGFQNFLTEEASTIVLSLQNDRGCMPLEGSQLEELGPMTDQLGEGMRLLGLLRKEAYNIKHRSRPVTGRKLLREQIMEGDCLAHKTGLGFGLIGTFIRHFTRLSYGPQELQH